MSIEEKYELFEAHLDGSLQHDEQLLFEKLMQEPETKKEFDEYAAIQHEIIHLTQHEEKEKAFIANLKNIASQQNAENTIDKKQSTKPTWQISTNTKWILSAAAVLLFGLFIGQQYFNTPTGSAELYATNYTPEELSIERGTTDDSLQQIANLYSAKKYGEAIPRIQAFMATHSQHAYLAIHLAICFLETSDYKNAEETLSNIIQQNNVYKEKAQWYLAMLYLKQGDKEKAKVLLQQFGEQHFYHKKAKAILNEME